MESLPRSTPLRDCGHLNRPTPVESCNRVIIRSLNARHLSEVEMFGNASSTPATRVIRDDRCRTHDDLGPRHNPLSTQELTDSRHLRVRLKNARIGRKTRANCL